MSQFTAPNISELMDAGSIIQVDPTCYESEEEDSDENLAKELYKHANLDCVLEDEDDYSGRLPFAQLAEKMQDILPEGKIKKRVLRSGIGNQPEHGSVLKVHYNAYTEFKEVPFDSTYVKSRKPLVFTLNSSEILPGFDIGISTMKLNEKSQFLIHNSLAYGEPGCPPRIPPEATVLLEVELLEIINGAVADQWDNLPVERKREFKPSFEYAHAQCIKAKDLFNRNINSAIREYNYAANALERCEMTTKEQEEQQQELLMKIYSNLLVGYTRINEPKKGCINFNKMNYLAKGTDLQISAKAYFNNAKCLLKLGAFEMAKNRLLKAQQLEPRNSAILDLFPTLDREQKKYADQQKNMARALVKNE